MKRLLKHILILMTVGATFCACQKWYLMIVPPEINDDSLEDEDGQGGEKLESVFVTVYGDGDMNGSSWDNAYDVDGLRTILTDRSDLSRVAIYMAEGTYLVSPVEGPGLELCKNIKSIKGGYSSSSTGKDLSKRDISIYETILSGDVNRNGVADAGDCAMFMITDGFISFDGVVFENGYVDTKISANNTIENLDGKSSLAAAALGIYGDPLTTVVDLTDCVFRGNVSVSAHNGSYLGNSSVSGGPCALISAGLLRARGCTFKDNKAENRGGAIRMNGRDGALFLDRCSFSGNELTGSSDGWGASIQLSYGHVCSNNCTFINDIGKGGDINGGGSFFFCNSSIFQPEKDTYGAFRCESKGGCNTMFINNLFTSLSASGKGFNYNTDKDDRDITSLGFNVFKSITGQRFETATDVLWPDVLTGQLVNGCYEWDYNQIGKAADEEYATVEMIQAAAISYCPTISENTALAYLGVSFATWVGDEGFRVDQRGRPRNPQCIQKGSYDAYIQVVQPTKVMLFATAANETFPHTSFYLSVNNPQNPFFSYQTKMIKKEGKWTTEDGMNMMWDPDMTRTNFLGLAPYVEVSNPSDTVNLAVTSDQRYSGIENDIMLVKQDITPTQKIRDNGLSLQFNHQMAKVLIKVSGYDVAKMSDVKLNGTVLEGFCVLGDVVPVAKAVAGTPTEILAAAASNGYECYIMPQTAASGIKVGFILDEMSYEWKSSGAVTFESGRNYTLTLTVAGTKSGKVKVDGVLSKID